MTLIYSNDWYASQLYTVAVNGDRISCGNAQLMREGEFFVMSGPTGRHSLSISATDASRLQTHWKGFIQRTEATTVMVPSKVRS